ncbi:MAG TPA: cytochrome c [Paenibacillaceae bacterium]
MHKWLMAGLICVACLVGVGLLIWGMPPKEEAAHEPEGPGIEVPAQPADAAMAEASYKSNCLGCHGDQLQGGFGPALNAVGASLSREQIYEIISKGKGNMPGFGGRLSDEEIINLANWLAEMGS